MERSLRMARLAPEKVSWPRRIQSNPPRVTMAPFTARAPASRPALLSAVRASHRRLPTCTAYTIGEMEKLGTDHEGVAHRMIRDLYTTAMSSNPRSFRVYVQFVQVYVEKVYDLLAERGDLHRNLPLREDKARGVYVDGAKQLPAASADECLEVLRKASHNLQFAATAMNAHSSRSHALCQLRVEISTAGSSGGPPPMHDPLAGSFDHLDGVGPGGDRPTTLQRQDSMETDHVDGGPKNLKRWRRKSVDMIKKNLETAAVQAKTTKATLTLCDLAGSEDVGRSGAQGKALSEAKKINTSLLALGNVINALTSRPGGQNHVPFRDSVLTRMLQESIGGDCKTCLVVCASPADSDVTETLSTLRFAARAKRVKNVAKIHATIEASALATDQMAEELQKQLDSEMDQLVEARARSERVAARAMGTVLQLSVQRKKLDAQYEQLAKETAELEKAKALALEARAYRSSTRRRRMPIGRRWKAR